MRWDDLFDDLSAQACAVVDGERWAEAGERARDELARTSLLDRVAVAATGRVDVATVDGEQLRGVLLAVGDGWLSVGVATDEMLVVARAVSRVRCVPSLEAGPTLVPSRESLGLRPVLRALGRRRVFVRIATSGGRRDCGTLDGVGADHLVLAEHPADRPRRAADVRALSYVPFDALLWLRYAGS